MATVWCAHDVTLDRSVAVKLLASRFAHDDAAVRRFKREARTAARLSAHANVVTIFDVGQTRAADDEPARPFIVMEYLPGGTVADAHRQGAVSSREALRWLRQAAAALDYAHARGVVHRDVKLSNFLLDRDRVLHVADFGIARLGTDDTLTSTGQVIGTAAYLAPERALGEPATDASDRYALAVAAYELLVGERPFSADHFTLVARAHLEDPPPVASRRNPALPRAVDPVLARGMAKRPEERWPTATALADALEQAMTGTTTVAMPRTRAAAAAPGAAAATARGRLVAVAALAAVLVGVIVALAAGGSGGPKPSARLAAHSTHELTTPSDGAMSTQTSTPSTTATTTSTPSAPASPPSADALEAQGHQLMSSGKYQAALPLLRKAVATAPHDSLTYAYALYDLGRSLMLAGDPGAAIPILRQRLQIPNQTGVVAATLNAALQAAGQSTGGAASGKPGKHPKDHHGPGHGGGGG
jgi:tetratricopeptide (TPR) repeat protein